MPDTTAPGKTRILLLGAVGNGAAAAAAMWIGQHHLGLSDFAPLAQLWTLWGLIATGLVFSVQQWEVVRHARAPTSALSPVPRPLMVRITLGTTLLVATLLVSREQVFGTQTLVWPLVAGTLPLGTAVTGWSYGYLARHRRFGHLATVMIVENALRLATTVALVLTDAPATSYAVTVPAGFLVVAIPLLAGARLGGPRPQAGHQLSIGGLALVGFATNAVVFAGPLLLSIAGGPPVVVSALFLVLVPIRVPFLLANASIPGVTVAATTMAVRGDTLSLPRLTRRIVVGAIAAAFAGAVGGYLFGDTLSDLLFGTGDIISDMAYALLGATVALCIGATFTNVLNIAMGATTRTTLVWSAVGVSGLALAALGSLSTPAALGAWTLVSTVAVLVVHVLPHTTGAPHEAAGVKAPPVA
jgi:hypothetical protein